MYAPGTTNESCAASPRITVGQNGTGGPTAALVENRISGFGENVFAHHPSVALNGMLQAGTSWDRSGASYRLGAVAVVKYPGGVWTFAGAYAPGTCAYTTTTRTGEYGGAQTDPVNLHSFWLAGEQAVAVSGLTGCNWATRIAQVIPMQGTPDGGADDLESGGDYRAGGKHRAVAAAPARVPTLTPTATVWADASAAGWRVTPTGVSRMSNVGGPWPTTHWVGNERLG